MKFSAEKLLRPSVIVGASCLLAVALFLLIHAITPFSNFTEALILSLLIPFAISFPISIISIGVFQRLKAKKEELVRINDINKRMFSIISHDVRSPLNTIKMMNDMILEGHVSREETTVYFEKFSKDVDTLLLFLEDILSWSKRQINNQPDKLELFHAGVVIRDIYELFSSLLGKKDVDLLLKDIECDVYFSKDNYSFIVRNVIHNAIKFTPAGGTVTVSTIEKKHEVHTLVQNQGKAITSDVIKRITEGEDWYTERGTDDEKGTGFGIRTCIQYLNKVNGRMEFKGDEGVGTTVTIIIPKLKS